jgi:hypothetical protein
MVEISRTDVVTDRILELEDPRRFIKIPIGAYLNLLKIEPIESQIAIINAINSPKYRFICAALSRRQGKTYIANIIGQMVSLIPSTNILIMSPNYSLSQISFELQRNLIKHFDLEVERDNAKDKIIELSNGSTVRMGSVNMVDSCVGRSYDLIIFDEAALAEGRDAFNVALRPTLDKENSKAILSVLLVVEITGSQSFTKEALALSSPLGAQSKLLTMLIHVLVQKILMKLSVLCQKLSSCRNMSVALMHTKARSGTLILKHIPTTLVKWI